jgi:DNA invertase Pin-like site-specific DNA recombinase
MPKAYSYIRFSTREQNKGSSIYRQTRQTQKFADRYNLDLQDDSFEDLGVSAFRGDHARSGALAKFIEAVESGKITKGSWLLIESIDRLGRDQLNLAFSRFQHLLSLGITIATIGDNKVFSPNKADDLGEIMVSLVSMSRAHEESVRKSQLSAGAWEKTRENVHKTGSAPAKGGIVPWWLKKKADGTYTVISDRGDAIRQMFRWSLEGYGSTKLAKLMAEHYQHLDPDKAWTSGVISNLTRGKTVLGFWQPRKQELSESGSKRYVPVGDPVRLYPSVIEEGTWLRVQQMRKARDSVTGRAASVEGTPNLFSGLLRCRCGATVRLQHKQSLVCRTGEYGKPCDHRQSVLKQFFEPMVLAALHKYLKEHAIENDSTEALRQELEDEEGKLAVLRQRAKEEEAKADQASLILLEELGNIRERMIAKAQELQRSVEDIKGQITRVQEQRDNLRARLDGNEEDDEDIIEVISGLAGTDEGRHKVSHALRRVVDSMKLSATSRQLEVLFKAPYNTTPLKITWEKPMRGRLKSIKWESKLGGKTESSGMVSTERPKDLAN